ncbi:hypothetical protein JXE04_01700, partial [Patescibacteria group bacterium]|nr:hypothetical protein [Patescibacteria group bacterium]
ITGLATYTVTATNSGGSTSFGVVMTVNDVVYTLTYLASSNGTISGLTTQIIMGGSNGEEVIAVSNAGYHFVNWSDGVTTATRIDVNVSRNISVTANFAIDTTNDNTNGSENNFGAPVILPAAIGSGNLEASIPMNESRSIGTITNAGTNILGYINSQANFQAPESSNSWQTGSHSLKISNLDLSNNTISITIYSEPQILDLQKGESKLVDLDGDAVSDIEVTFTNIYINRAEVTVKTLDSQIIGDVISNNKASIVAYEEQELSTKTNTFLMKRLAGQILLQVETKGQAWYLDPVSLKRYYLADGESAYQALRKFGLGITNFDLEHIPAAFNSSLIDEHAIDHFDYSLPLINRLKGRILLQVENHGEAWYVNPADGLRYYLADGNAAYQIMRNLSLGINNTNLRSITVGFLE